VQSLYLGLFIAATLILLLSLFSRVYKERWYLTEPLTAFGLGVLIGPAGFQLFDISDWGNKHSILLEASRLTLVIADMGVALRLPSGYLFVDTSSGNGGQ
jgi:NhaP-type Na+/H+ or K+/H+ antiporter